MAQTLVRTALQMIRTAELLGASVDNIIRTSDWPSGLGCNCIEEAKQRCKEGHGNAGEVLSVILSISRQSQLLGARDCAFGNEEQLANELQSLPCKLPWMGWVDYLEAGDKTTVTASQTSTVTESGLRRSQTQLVVVKADLVEASYPIPSFGGDTMEKWQLTLEGVLSSKDQTSVTKEVPGECGAKVESSRLEAAGAAAVRMKVDFKLLNGGLKSFTFSAYSNHTDRIEMKGIDKEYTFQPSCFETNGVTHRTWAQVTNFVDIVGFSPRTGETFPTVSTNAIRGDFLRPKVGRAGGLQANDINWRFNFYRDSQ